MANLKLALGLIPKTNKVEQEEIALIKEFEKLHSFVDSEELARYNELDAVVNTPEFKSKRKEIEGLQYKASEEHHREQEFNKLHKSKEMVMYFKTHDSANLIKFREMDGSDRIARHDELKKVIDSNEFKQKKKMKPITFKRTEEYKKLQGFKKQKSDPTVKKFLKLTKSGNTDEANELAGSERIIKYKELETFVNSQAFLEKKNMKPITFKDTEEFKLLTEYKDLDKNPDVKFYYKFKSSKNLAHFNQVEGSQKLARHEELKEYLAGEKFKEKKEYLLDKKRFEKTDSFKQFQEHDKLKKSDDIVWYFSVKDSKKFDVLKERKLTFSDEFDGERLDMKKWMPGNYWGEKLLNDRYSQEDDLHCFTEADNFEVRSSMLRISTKHQKSEGKVWNPVLGGFRMKDFEYTTGIINSGKSFRQKYGVFTAKIKLNTSSGPKHAFWMLADKITPHMDICRTESGKVWMDLFNNGQKGVKTSIGGKYSKDFFIYTLEWTADKLIWKINGFEAFRQTSNVPQEEMYLIFSGGLNKPISGSSAMEIDWVRVYQWV